MLDRVHGLTRDNLHNPISPPEPRWVLLPFNQSPGQVPAITIPQESKRFSHHPVGVLLIRRGVLQTDQVPVKNCLEKDTNRPTLLNISLCKRTRDNFLCLLLAWFGMKN